MSDYSIYYGMTALAFLITFGAQAYIRSMYDKYSRIDTYRHIKGNEAANIILQNNGLNEVSVNQVTGYLQDHYNPKSKMVALTPNNYESTSIASVAVSCHECGHALQDKEGYALLRLRADLFPVVRFSSFAGYTAITIGIIFSLINMIYLGIFLEIIVLLFQFITLPIEFDASSRALEQIIENNILSNEEVEGARKVLNAAALTYVASVSTTLIEIVRLMIMVRPRNNRRN